eukprot:5967881-Heterocapsa_arctica.AAC.1
MDTHDLRKKERAGEGKVTAAGYGKKQTRNKVYAGGVGLPPYQEFEAADANVPFGPPCSLIGREA